MDRLLNTINTEVYILKGCAWCVEILNMLGLSHSIERLFSSRLSPPTLLSSWLRHRSAWRYTDWTAQSAWPNYKPSLTHRKHRFLPHTYGCQSTTRLRVVDNSTLGREAMAEGKPPKVFHVYSKYHSRKPHGAYGKLGDRVLMAILGQKKKGIIVGLKIPQLPGIPRFDTNNVVLIDDTGNPLGTRIHAPIPNCIRSTLRKASNPKKADYTKLLAIATKFV